MASVCGTTVAVEELSPARDASIPLLAHITISPLRLDRLSPRASSCSLTQVPCNGACMPVLNTCCSSNAGSCPVGQRCDGSGCCLVGGTCSGVVGGCNSDQVSCGDSCMPKGGNCCGGGKFCDPGYGCTGDLKCRRSDSSANGAYAGTRTQQAAVVAALTALLLFRS
ncbi:hypothetical protein RJ55_03086 [Drechmeria coniospora]|nr:hypothetical protein RJ55_03086 [Drechmeria coniospora]